MTRLRDAVVAWAAGGQAAAAAGEVARRLAPEVGLRTVVLVEGISDLAAIERLAERSGRDLDADGVCVVPLGGATSIGRFLDLLGPRGLGVRIVGLCDAREQGFFRRALDRAGLDPEGFHVCDADLEHELIRALGVAGVERVIEGQGELATLRTFQHQPAQRVRTPEHQLHRFLGTMSGRKERYAGALVDALDLDRVPKPLDDLMADL
ncbi:ATP-dependent endonuclease [Aeromicrobium sp. NPDC092404]|uniref:ATP-dependent endonuclease n=1 Tax=Aeromicrobium sp. NPDC092404 TaxID=3154976 RepID=UPI00341BE2DD